MPITMDRFFDSISHRPIRVGARMCIEGRSPRNADGQASDAVAIGIDPRPLRVDGCGRVRQVPTLLTIAIVSLASLGMTRPAELLMTKIGGWDDLGYDGGRVSRMSPALLTVTFGNRYFPVILTVTFGNRALT